MEGFILQIQNKYYTDCESQTMIRLVMNQYQFILLSNNVIILELSLEIEYKRGCNHLQPFRKYSSSTWS